MELHGKNQIGATLSARGRKTFSAFDPRQGKTLDPAFFEATGEEIEQSLKLAAEAFPAFRASNAETVSGLLEAIAEEILALGEPLIDRAAAESGLTKDRLTGERARTTNQLRLFAALVKEGSFVDARIDTALPDRKPVPRPDLRRMLIPIGPVVVFAASNFPLAFSVAGGDTASALAARNPVVVKAHPAHPGTSELVAGAVARAVHKAGLPEGVFSMLHSADPATSIALVRHPETKAVAFTGSSRAGRAIFDAASGRPDPIPAFVEMGSVNPVFILPGALEQPDALAQGLFNSVNLGVGQFCTCPGLIIGNDSDAFNALREKLAGLFQGAAPGTMLYPGILTGYDEAAGRAAAIPGVQRTRAAQTPDPTRTEATPTLFETDAATWLDNHQLRAEIFGPASLVVRCRSDANLLRVASALEGTLTATVYGTSGDLARHRDLISVLETKAGRLIFNGLPTGVEVSPAMHHGGPWPATADAKFTSVGTAAILRFLRPVCYQNLPDAALPPELRNDNPRGIWRTVNGRFTTEAIV
ncbi:MAG: aldehyde dehydrogenase (NADP(+)) [Bryobacteraceae bacterium]|jgi:NADP-dependent aldehyde dehydrogenase